MSVPNPFQPSESRPMLLRAMIYGPSGVGKTHHGLATRDHIGGQVALAYTEDGARWHSAKPDLAGYSYLHIRSFDDLRNACDFLESGQADFGCLVVDTLTELFELRKSAHEIVDKKSGRPMIPLPAWGVIRRQHVAMVRRLLALPVHLVCIAREVEVVADDGTRTVYPNVDRKTDDTYEFDLAGRLIIHNEQQVLVIDKDRVLGNRRGTLVPFADGFSPWLEAAKDGGAYDNNAMLSPELAEERLRGCQSMDELKAAWSELTGYIRTIPADTRAQLEMVKDRCKQSLSRPTDHGPTSADDEVPQSDVLTIVIDRMRAASDEEMVAIYNGHKSQFRGNQRTVLDQAFRDFGGGK